VLGVGVDVAFTTIARLLFAFALCTFALILADASHADPTAVAMQAPINKIFVFIEILRSSSFKKWPTVSVHCAGL
jgi:hypothetical protein